MVEVQKALNGVEYLLKNKPEALSAGWALNEGGGGSLDENGKRVANGIQAGEKVYQDFDMVGSRAGQPAHAGEGRALMAPRDRRFALPRRRLGVG